MSGIKYPSGCKALDFDMAEGELLHRLKLLSNKLQELMQDSELAVSNMYTPLSLYLVDDFFLNHNSKDVQLLVACCIADLIRIYAPEAPYKDQDQISEIFMFMTNQLTGLIDQNHANFKRYFYLLENLTFVKSYSMCFEITNNQEVFQDLFHTLFSIISNNLSSKVKTFLVDMALPLITDSDQISFELLDLILSQLIEPNKSSNVDACKMSKELIFRTKDTLEPYIKAFLNHLLLEELEVDSYKTALKVFELLIELHSFIPSMLIDVMPNLECKLKSSVESDRIKTVQLLGKLFSNENSALERDSPHLWTQFLGRFGDISTQVRKACIQSVVGIFLNRKELRSAIEHELVRCHMDTTELVRHELVLTIKKIIMYNVEVACKSEYLLNTIMQARLRDTQMLVRKEALMGLGDVVRNYNQLLLKNTPVHYSIRKAVEWIRNKVLHGYYLSTIEDRIIVEQLLCFNIVPANLSTRNRACLLYDLMGNIDDHAKKAFQEIQKNKIRVRKMVEDLVKSLKNKDTKKDQLDLYISCLAKLLPKPAVPTTPVIPVKTAIPALVYLGDFCELLKNDPSLLSEMDALLMPNASVKGSIESTKRILKKWGDNKKPGFQTLEKLFIRFSTTLFDKEFLQEMMTMLTQRLEAESIKFGDSYEKPSITENIANGNEAESLEQLPKKVSCEKWVKTITELAYVYTDLFKSSPAVLKQMVYLMTLKLPYVVHHFLHAFAIMGRFKPLIQTHSDIVQELAPICKKYAQTGTPKQAKRAVQCICVNSQQPLQLQNNNNDMREDVVQELVESLSENLNPASKQYRTTIVVLGHIAFNQPDKYNTQIKNIISRKIVKELLVKEVDEDRMDVPNLDFCDEEELPEDTRRRVEGLKTMARWLIGLKKDVNSAHKTFRMLNAFIKKSGDLTDQNRLSKAEKSWLRLSAGNCMLKICEQDGVGDQYTNEQFYTLSHLMIDEVEEVRQIFTQKLHKGINNNPPHKCLSLEFMGIYALAGREKNKAQQAKTQALLKQNLQRRREYVKSCTTRVPPIALNPPHILPDYTIAFAIAVLTHDPNFTNPADFSQLREIENCLWFVLEPLSTTGEHLRYCFYKELFSRLKHHKSAYKGDEKIVNEKMWVMCDLALHLIKKRVNNLDMKDYDMEPQIPLTFFQPQNETFENIINYIPLGFHNPRSRSGSPVPQVSTADQRELTNRVPSKRATDSYDSDESKKSEDVSSTNEENVDEPPKKQTRLLRTRAKK